MGTAKSDSDIAMAIGNLALSIQMPQRFANDFDQGKVYPGYGCLPETFENGTLVSLAKTVGDGGQYLNVLRRKFDADAANWVWNVETAQQKIREVILE